MTHNKVPTEEAELVIRAEDLGPEIKTCPECGSRYRADITCFRCYMCGRRIKCYYCLQPTPDNVPDEVCICSNCGMIDKLHPDETRRDREDLKAGYCMEFACIPTPEITLP